MKICFLLTQFEVGGAQTRVFQTATELRGQGHTVDILALYEARPCFLDQPKTILSPSKNPIQLLLGIFKLWGILVREHYDVFISNTAPANILGNAVAFLAAQPRRISWQTQPPERLNPIYQFIDHLFGTIGIYTRTVANSEWTRSRFQFRSEYYQARMRTIMNGLNPRVDARSKAITRASLNIPLDKRIIVSVGRLSRQKGHETIITALGALPDVYHYIVGDGELKEALRTQAKYLGVENRVVFCGEVDGDQVAAYLRAGDVFCFPSRWETFGLALVEAAASGIPILATQLDVVGEVLRLEDGTIAGELVGVDDVGGWSSAISRVLYDSVHAEKLSSLSLKLRDRHSLSGHVKNILALIEEIDATR
jgi:glycosyltransferase involved in cell wall biosynthesis